MEIASSVRECLTKFRALREQDARVEDEHGRFRIWAGNISAHRTGRRSLEYRLRDSSNLRATVKALLKDLRQVLDQLEDLAGQQSLPELVLQQIPSSTQGDTESESIDDEDAKLFGLDDENPSANGVFEQALDEAHEVITCLLRLSMTLRNPARHDLLKQAAGTTTRHFEPHDINHVQEKYPDAAEFLQRRLGKAISKNRQYFKYREEHHLKLSEGLDEADDDRGDRPSTVATSVQQPGETKAVFEDKIGETESIYTATSFAPSTAGDTSLKPPPLPEAGRNGEPFECPLCYGGVVAQNQHSWRQHVYEDLPPYVCIFETCQSADHKYTRRRDWQRHLTKSHNRYWVCAFGCSGNIRREEDFREHLRLKHGQVLDAASLKHLADACAVADGVVDLTCPLCRLAMPTSQRWFKHVGNHLQQFALHALPLHMLASDSDDEADSVHDSEETDNVHDSDDIAVEASTRPPVKVSASSYWSVPEQNDFIKYIGHFGRDFAAIAAHMGTKTQTMVKNHYQRQVDGGNRPELEQSAIRAEERRMRGEDLGPPPQPAPIVRRKYPVEDEDVKQSSSLELGDLPAGDREDEPDISPGVSLYSRSTESVHSYSSEENDHGASMYRLPSSPTDFEDLARQRSIAEPPANAPEAHSSTVQADSSSRPEVDNATLEPPPYRSSSEAERQLSEPSSNVDPEAQKRRRDEEFTREYHRTLDQFEMYKEEPWYYEERDKALEGLRARYADK